MGLECMIVFAHATGRTLVIPPQDHIYLLEKKHKDEHDKHPHDDMGFEDFFDIELLKSHKGLNVITMKEFLEREGITGNLKGIFPPNNNTDITGNKLWKYLEEVADQVPEWFNKVVVMPGKSMDFNMSISLQNRRTKERLDQFLLNRPMLPYDQKLQNAMLIHSKAGPEHRILEHFYAFAFFADSFMQTYYKRFIRDYVRYKDSIQCIGHDFIKLLRQESIRLNPLNNGEYYALHVRRGDFQYAPVKISAEKIVANLHYLNGTPIIPPGSLVYISTDDPKGICQGCHVILNKQYRACKNLPHPRPVGCPNATGWGPFEQLAGWNIRFLHNYQHLDQFKSINPNIYGLVESLICSRATKFVGTFFSTYSGYIHRLRGYHGLGERTYYHSTGHVFNPQIKRSYGQGFPREWRSGWTDDEGFLV